MPVFGLAMALLGFTTSPARSQTPPPSPAHVYATIVAPSLALVVSEGGQKVGTAFCIATKGATSYFLTNAHVILDEHGKPESFSLVFPGHPSQPIVGKVIKSGSAADPSPTVAGALVPDLAVLAADIPFAVTTLSINAHTPSERWASDIAGFPTRQANDWRDSQQRVLRGATVPGSIGSFTGLFGDANFYIYYNATTDAGDSGGPLYDPRSGSVYGVIKGIVGGDFASVQQGVAIPASTVVKFLSDVPSIAVAMYTPSQESIDSEELQGAPRKPKHLQGTPACLAAVERLSKDFGDWYQLRNALVDTSTSTPAPAGLSTQLRRGQLKLAAFDRALKSDVHAVSSTSNGKTVHLSESLLSDVADIEAADARIFAQPGSSESPLETVKLKTTLHRFGALTTCSPGP